MEFKIEKDRSGDYVLAYTINGLSGTEKIPREALWDRGELFKYCERRMHALEDKFKRLHATEYAGINDDLNKEFVVQGKDVVSKGSNVKITR